MAVLAHTRLGSGPPLVLIHGIGSRKEAWTPVIGHVAEHREVIALDLPGFGASPMPPAYVLTPRQLADSVMEFCAAIGLDKPHVAGNSLGGWIALEMARAPDGPHAGAPKCIFYRDSRLSMASDTRETLQEMRTGSGS